jgi:transposase-like protein
MPEDKPVCPYCQSTLTVRLGNETHCNACGKSFDLDRNPIATEAANRKAQRSGANGWPERRE